LHKIFLPPIFFLRFFCSWVNRIPWPKICRKLWKWSSQVADLKLRTYKKIAVAELRLRSNISIKKVRNCDCGSASFKLRNCDCGLKKKLRVPTSAIF
jgi:hypothetical protein